MKTKKRKANDTAWTAQDHAIQAQSRRRHLLTETQERRRHLLTHDTQEKKTEMRLKLHLTKTRRAIEFLKQKLENWDEQEELENEKKRLEQQLQQQQPKIKGRKGPETWKLKGAARPAWQVYDFDTRYIDPHMQAHEKAREKAKRCKNILALYRGKFGSPTANVPEQGRDYLSLLMQLGHLSKEARQFKSAREAWLQCVELEGDLTPVTCARECLMRMYLDLDRLDAAYRLGERFPNDSSVWMRYSLALVAFKQRTDNAVTPYDDLMVEAIRSNPFCAYYLAFYDTFSDVIEYAEELEEADDEPQSSLEEAIEYGSSSYAKEWVKVDANKTLRDHIVRARAGSHNTLSLSDLEWSDRLKRIEEDFLSRAPIGNIDDNPIQNRQDSKVDNGDDESDASGSRSKHSSEDPNSDNDDETGQSEDEHPQVDVAMFAGMFRTAMEMLEESGSLA